MLFKSTPWQFAKSLSVENWITNGTNFLRIVKARSFEFFPSFFRNKRPLFAQKIPARKRLVTFMLNWKQKAINAKAGKRKSLQYMPVSYCAAE